uniref:Glycoprotein VI platelet n=1 Tax=Propithecus coquereli TaxID=379532 RepID=A0A2K6GSZ7_PROCO
MSPTPSALFCLGEATQPLNGRAQALGCDTATLPQPLGDLTPPVCERAGRSRDTGHRQFPSLPGVYNKPSLLAQPSPAVSPGGDVTLQCQTPYSFDQFALYKEGDPEPYKNPEMWYRASFPIVTVTAAHSGTYRCYSFSSSNPYEWSAPSDPLELVVTGTSVTPSQLPAGPPSSVTEASRKQNVSPSSKVSPTETSRNITSSPEESGSPIAPARLHYTKGNLARICLGAAILILLAGLLAEDWHRRRRPLLHRVRAVQRPLPPLPQTQRSHGCPERGRPDARHQGLHP